MGDGGPAERITALTRAFERLARDAPGLRVGSRGGGGSEGDLVDPESSLMVTLASPEEGRRAGLHVSGSGAELRVWPPGAGEDAPRPERLDLGLEGGYCWDGIRFETAEQMAEVLLRHLERRLAANREGGR